jgi:hypothetical protein
VTEDESSLRGHVAKLITDDELLLNIGSADGVKYGMTFEVLDQETENVYDPVTGKNLGSIDRVKTKVRVFELSEHLSLAHITTPRYNPMSSAAQVMLGQPAEQPSARLTGDTWPDGVRVADPVRQIPPRSQRDTS